MSILYFFFQAEDGIRDFCLSRGLGDVYKRQMYGLPGQSLESWQRTMARCLALNPTHLSCYALTVEANTKLADNIHRQRSQAPDEGLQIEMDEAAQRMLGNAGYERYEISNYARPGYACRHNLLYWTSGESVSYTHLRAHETGRNLVCRLLLEKK